MKKIIKNKNFVIIAKILVSLCILYLSALGGFISLLFLESNGINIILSFISALIVPSLLIPLIFIKKKWGYLKWWLIVFALYVIALSINYGIEKYNEKITINTSVNINVEEYLPFKEDTKIVKLDHESDFRFTDNLPIIDGATALFPVYSSYVNAIYPKATKLYDGVFEYSNTVGGYEKLANKDIDVFFGAYPSNEQIEYAKSLGTDYVYTKIGNEAFVFFVHKDNPVTSLTQDEVRKIYSGEITNWKDVGGSDEEIVAFQRNEGSGSQSMLIRFMGETSIMSPPSEMVNNLMIGIINEVSKYKNKTSSLGFSFRYYLEGIIKNPDVRCLSIDGVAPNIDNIKNGIYPITTPLYAVTYSGNDNQNIDKLIEYVLSEDGQEILERTGYAGVK